MSYNQAVIAMSQPATNLFRNIQFIYELELAHWELAALGAEYSINSDLRHFQLGGVTDETRLVRRVAYFEHIKGKRTDYAVITSRNRTRSPNQFLTHWIYPYKGKFHPQMIRALLNIVGVKTDDTVLDPFVGSGTAALETQLLGINFIGYDISPLCVLQSRVKTESQEALDAIEETKESILAAADPSLFRGADNSALSEVIAKIPDEQARNFYRLAELLSYSDVARRGRDFAASFARNVVSMLTSVRDYREVADELALQLGEVSINQMDARHLPLKSGSVDAIITSPPYSIALDYVANDAHALTALGYDLSKARELFIGVRGIGQKRVDLYNQDMKQVLEELYRVLRRGRYCVLVLGNATYQGKEIPTVEFATEVCKGLGMTLVREIEKIIFGLYNVMQSESILVFRKE